MRGETEGTGMIAGKLPKGLECLEEQRIAIAQGEPDMPMVSGASTTSSPTSISPTSWSSEVMSRLVILVAISVTFLGAVTAGGAQLPAPQKDALKLVFFLSESLAPDLPLFTRTLAAGRIDGEKADTIVVKSRPPRKATITELHLYVWRPTGFKEVGLFQEDNVILSALAVADLGYNSKDQIIYYTPVFDDPDKVTGAFVIIRKEGDQLKRERHLVPVDAQPQALGREVPRSEADGPSHRCSLVDAGGP